MKYFLVLITVIFISVISLLHPGFPQTHDGDVHLLRLTNFYQSLKEGNIIPRWAANVNFGYGQPVFEFFYPLPLYLASLIHFFRISYADSLKILLIAGMFFSGISMYFWLNQILSKQAALIGATLYVYAPYRFIDTYVRGDIGENLAYIFIPLILLSTLKLEGKNREKWLIIGSISLALLILSHNVMSLLFLPFIVFYGFCTYLRQKERKIFLNFFIWLLILGFALSAFFWLPGLIEGKYTLRNIVTKGEYASRFVSFQSLIYGNWSYGGTGAFSVQLGIMQWLTILGSIIVLFIASFRKKTFLLLHIGILVYTLLAIFFMLPASNFIWTKIILLQNFQFPWRFLTVTVFASAVLSANLINLIPKKYIKVIVPIIILIIIFLNKDYMRANAYVVRRDNFFSGIQRSPADTGESTPIWSVRFMEEGYQRSLDLLMGGATILPLTRTSTNHVYKVEVSQKSRFIENTLYFPGWQILANGFVVPIEFQDQAHRGIITFYLNPGNYIVEAKFSNTKFRNLSDYTSLVAFLLELLLIAHIFLKNIIYAKIKK